MASADYSTYNRRHFLKHLAGLSMMALPGMQFVQTLRAAAPTLKKENKSVIILWMSGGPPTIDIWDLKPGQATGGDFKSIKTSAPGVEISEYLPTVAKQMKNLAIIRSLSTNEGDHMRGRILMHTARVPSPIVSYPSLGSMASYYNYEVTKATRDLALPGFIAIGRPADGPGFLGMNYAPFTVQDPGRPPQNIKPPASLGTEAEALERAIRRKRLFYDVEGEFNQGLAGVGGDAAKLVGPSKAHNDIYGKAFSLVTSKEGKVFDISTEKKTLQDEYGANVFGRGCLLARRLVESGVTCVEVDLGGWDLHAGCQAALKTKLPMMDKGMGTLVKDLSDRRMLENTVVVWMGEFGRTPRINQNAGRDHWARCWSVVVGGGSIKGGQVFGATDEDGTSIKGDDVATVGDLFATVYKGMGIDPTMQIRDNLGRPLPIAPEKSNPIKQLFS